jgi:hypothetical protein
LAAAIEALQTEFFGSIVVALTIEPGVDGEDEPLPPDARDAMHDVVRETLLALQAAEAWKCGVTLRRSGAQVMLNILSDVGGGDFDPTRINAHANRCQRLGGYLSVERLDGSVAVSAELSLAAGATAAAAGGPAPDASADAPGADNVPNDVEPGDTLVDDGTAEPAEPTPSSDTGSGAQDAA